MNVKPRDFLIYFSVKYRGSWDRIYQAINAKESPEEQEIIDTVNKVKCQTVTILDEEYPLQLKQIVKPPFVLYCKGDIGLLKGFRMNLGVIGSREPSDYATKNLNRIIKDIALDYVVVSGCAFGIDGLAHQASINNGGRTIGVLGCGIDVIYPRENTALINRIADKHLLISEYPEGEPVDKEYFIPRNRIVVGLSYSVLAFDVREKSGSFSTVNHVLRNNRNLLSIPYPIGTEFLNNSFIKDGCSMIENGDDIRFIHEKF